MYSLSVFSSSEQASHIFSWHLAWTLSPQLLFLTNMSLALKESEFCSSTVVFLPISSLCQLCFNHWLCSFVRLLYCRSQCLLCQWHLHLISACQLIACCEPSPLHTLVIFYPILPFQRLNNFFFSKLWGQLMLLITRI